MYNTPHGFMDDCPVCQGKKQIELGRNLDNKFIETISCPICNAKGYISVLKNWFAKESERFRKRMSGQDE